MIAHLILFRLSSWLALSKVQRRFVWKSYVHPLLVRWPLMVAKMCLGFLAIIIAYWTGGFSSFISSMVVIFIVAFAVPELLDFFPLSRRRHDIEMFIKTHDADIQSVV